jgi:hypothetical protein
MLFVKDLASRLKHRVQITTDGHRPYLEAVEKAFGGEVDYSILQKIYGSPMENETRYSPAKCIGVDVRHVSGNPNPKHISTSYVERQNWNVRTKMRRYTRLSNGFSRKAENHFAATSLHYFAYNFIQIHDTLRTSPAQAVGVTDKLWEVNDLVALLESYKKANQQKRLSNKSFMLVCRTFSRRNPAQPPAFSFPG